MGKRSSFKRKPRDFYPTPYEAVEPLLPHLKAETRFAEPCCGDMQLVRHLNKHGHSCYWASDIERRCQEQEFEIDALTLTTPLRQADCIITNPPWDRKILHPMIEHFTNLAPTWLLFDADWMHTKQSIPYMQYCRLIVSVGRVKWIPDSKMTGKDNCCWYFFSNKSGSTRFVGRK